MELRMRDVHWNTAPAELHLPVSEIHVWRAFLDMDDSVVHWLKQILLPEEKAQAARFRFNHDRRRFIVGRGLLRTVLACYLQVSPQEPMFAYGPQGKPYLASPSSGSKGICFNMSHSHRLALYAVAAGNEVGVDLERVTPFPDMAAIAERFFSPGEKSALRAFAEPEATEFFYDVWTKKEAYIKAIGKGFSQGLDRFTVALGSKESNALLEVDGDPSASRGWWLQRLEPSVGYLGAICIGGPKRPIYRFEASWITRS